jgi:alpha-acetolactate decarboxylase
MLGVYDGQWCIGHVVNRGKLGFEAFDQHDRPLSIFPTVKAAADAVSHAFDEATERGRR